MRFHGPTRQSAKTSQASDKDIDQDAQEAAPKQFKKDAAVERFERIKALCSKSRTQQDVHMPLEIQTQILGYLEEEKDYTTIARMSQVKHSALCFASETNFQTRSLCPGITPSAQNIFGWLEQSCMGRRNEHRSATGSSLSPRATRKSVSTASAQLLTSMIICPTRLQSE